jgi:PKD repeat protein
MLDGEPDYGAPPLTVRFETEANCTGGPVEFSWDFGDGSTGGNVPGPSHTYERQGEYVATVRVRAPDGGRSEDELEITVDATFEE